jgi:hypothetical protein
MDGYKLASVAGMITMATSVFVEYSVPMLAQVQPGSQPGATQPSHTQPHTQPGQPQPGAEKPTIRGIIEDREDAQPIFELRDESSEQKLQEIGRQLVRMEEQMKQSSQQLVNQINSARSLSGEQKVDALADVVQTMAQQHVHLGEYLAQMRETITGKVSPGRVQGIPEPVEKDDLIDLEKELKKDPIKPESPKDPLDHPAPRR